MAQNQTQRFQHTRDLPLPKWLVLTTGTNIPDVLRRRISSLAGINDQQLKTELAQGGPTPVAGCNSEQEAKALAETLSISGIDMTVKRISEAPSAAKALFILGGLGLLIALMGFLQIGGGVFALGVVLSFYFGMKGGGEQTKIHRSWNKLQGYTDNSELGKALSALQSARKTILLSDLSEYISHDLLKSVDELDEALDALTSAGKEPSPERLAKVIESAENLENAALADQNAAIDEASKAAEKAQLVHDLAKEMRGLS